VSIAHQIEVLVFTNSSGPQNLKIGNMTLATPISEVVCINWLKLTVFEASISTDYEYMTGDAKCRK